MSLPLNQQYPYGTVVRVDTTYADGQGSHGSGVMISHDEVLTAAHCVADDPVHGKVKSVEVTPALNGLEKPLGIIPAVDWHAMPIHLEVSNSSGGRAISQTDSAQDFGLIHLSHSISDGYMGIDIGFQGGSVNFTGYPDNPGVTQATAVVAAGRDPGIAHLLDFPADIAGGDSGSPLYYKANDGVAYTVGCVSASTSTSTCGPAYTLGDVAQLNQWIAQDHPNDPNHGLVEVNNDPSLWLFA